MQKSSEGGQLTLFDLDTSFGKMCPAPSPVENPRAKTSGASWKKSSKLKYAAYQSLDLTPGAGNLLGEFFWETLSPWRGDASMLNTGVSPREEKESSLSQILEAAPQKKYYLCLTAFMQTTLLFLGLLTFPGNMLLGLGIMLAANEVPRIAQQFGLDSSVRVNMMSVVHATTTAVNLTRSVARAAK